MNEFKLSAGIVDYRFWSVVRLLDNGLIRKEQLTQAYQAEYERLLEFRRGIN